MRLHAFQQAFASALWQDEVAPAIAGLRSQPGFAVYRNTVMKGCIDALTANYPALVALVGDEWLRAAAAVYVRASPPTQASLLDYGAGFADFLDGFEPASTLPWLADVARLERDWTEAHLAHDAASLDARTLAQATPAVLAQQRLHVHPATRWRWCAEVPVYSLWSINRGYTPMPEDGLASLSWHGEGALTTRCDDSVQILAVPRAACALLDACVAGDTLAAAAVCALEIDADLDLSALIASLLRAGAFTS